MTRFLLSFIFITCLFMGDSLQAQSPLVQKNKAVWQPQKMERDLSGEPVETYSSPAPSPFSYNPISSRDAAETETIIGMTLYDLQTNSTQMPRLFHFPDGQLSAIWTMSTNSAGFPDRGTGYNHFDGTNWMDMPDERLEADLRTGWPSIVGNANGDETIICHDFGAYEIHQLSRDAGDPDWTESTIPDNTPAGVVWARMAIGGSNGNTLHALAIAPPEVSNGVVYENVDGHILYYRSLDGGDTWDVQDFIIPGLDSTTANFHSVDSYAIEARGDVVVVAHFAEWHDVMIYKSTDNGETWTSMIVNDFPLAPDDIEGYTVDDLPPFDPAQPDSLAILTSDGSGSIAIDNNDMVHVFFGRMYVQGYLEGTWNFYPGTSGVTYWNESFAEGDTRVIADVIDADGNGIFDLASVDEIGGFGTSLTSHFSSGVDADNNIYLVYSGLTEDFIKVAATPNQQHCRHIYAMASKDGGDTWSEPFDMSIEEIVSEPDLLPFMEAMYPTMAKLVDNKIHLIYQFDFEPGLSVQGDMDAPGDNFIAYIGLDVAELGVVSSVKTVSPSEFAMQLNPNPAGSFVQVGFDLPKATSAEVGVYNAFGQQLWHNDLGEIGAGPYSAELDMSGFGSGVYYVRLTAGNEAATQRLVKN